ncbi:hypothetical protein [Streptomyces sp. NPDC096339]|uniref:hypothetical protein n=1 Tax=Streptomyces sp. NPDC096339 TaxID=3366086 RepID=UPI003809BFBE
MAVLTTISVVLGAWCAAGIMTAALYAAVRGRRVRRQRAMAAALEGTVGVPGQTQASEVTQAAPVAQAAEPAEATDTGHAAQALEPAQAAQPAQADDASGSARPPGSSPS